MIIQLTFAQHLSKFSLEFYLEREILGHRKDLPRKTQFYSWNHEMFLKTTKATDRKRLFFAMKPFYLAAAGELKPKGFNFKAFY